MMLLSRQSYLIRLRAYSTKPVDIYDILDAETREAIGVAWEKEPKAWAKWVRAAWGRNLVPATVHVSEQDNAPPVFSIREVSVLWPVRVDVTDAAGRLLGYFTSKFATIGGGFLIFDALNHQVAELEPSFDAPSYRFVTLDGREIGAMTSQSVERDISRLEPTEGYVVSLKQAVDPTRRSRGRQPFTSKHRSSSAALILRRVK